MIRDNLKVIQTRINELENVHQRTPGSVKLLAVSKKKPARDITDAQRAGQISFGENYADEGAGKIAELADNTLDWHFIGHVQSNKTRLIASHYQWVQSVERPKILQRLSQHRPANLPPLNVCLQVNIDDEQTKSGCAPSELPALAEMAAGLPQIALRGIMAIPAPQQGMESQRAVFAQVKTLFDNLAAENPQVDTLSMGMSADMEAAIAEGATMVRIGTAIFGSRD